MVFSNRPLVRLGAAALLASGVFAALGTPAYAAGPTDLSLDVVGTKLAAGVEGKLAFAKITNNGDETPSSLTVTADVSDVDFDKVAALPYGRHCEYDGEEPPLPASPVDTGFRWTCKIDTADLPGPGETVDIPVAVFNPRGFKGTYSAPITFTLNSPDDTNEANNTKSTTVELTGKNGPDLVVLADDVKQGISIEDGEVTVLDDLKAGQFAELVYTAVNQGDQSSVGLKSSIKLPKGVTFGAPVDGCEASADQGSAVCMWDDVVLIPNQDDTDGDDDTYSGVRVSLLIKVDEDVKAGTLPDGSVTVASMATEQNRRGLAKTKLPEHLKGLQADDVDVDPSDNTDGFAVIVAGESGGGGGGLPLTGPQAGLIGGIGVAVLAAGGAMFLVARRRRVVLVTPADEKPAA